MTRVKYKKVPGGKLCRTETVTIRLDPKLKYFSELAARRQRRTLSSYIEWLLSHNMSDTWLSPEISLNEEMEKLWYIDENDRLKKLALTHPELLTFEEEIKLREILKND